MKQILYVGKSIQFSIKCVLVVTLFALFANLLQAQTESSNKIKTIKGKITNTKGETLPSVNIIIKGTTQGVFADIDGNYSITIPDNIQNPTLRFVFMGYQEVEQIVGNKGEVNVVLADEVSKLDEVVVVGYGTQKKVNLTGAVEQVSGEVFENRAVSNIAQGLQGAVPNLNIQLLDGKPTQSPSFNIRGITSIGQQGSALILIDGVEGDPSLLNPNDVASISVLKDAASASIYGSRAAFGVVLIQTKNPEKDKITITYNGNVSFRRPTTLPDNVTDGYSWAKSFSESFDAWNDYTRLPTAINKTMPFSANYLEELRKRSLDPSLPKVEVDPNTKEYIYYGSTDWYDELYKKSTTGTEQSVSVAGSSDKVSYLLSGRYYNQEGLFKYNSDDFSSLSFRAKGSIKLYEWMTLSNNLDFSNNKYHNPLNVGEGGGIWRNIADEGHPVAMMFNPNGSLTHSSAYSVGDFWYGKNGRDTKRDELKNTTSLVMLFLDNKLRISNDITFANRDREEKDIRVEVPYSRTEGVTSYTGSNTNDIKNLSSRNRYLAINSYAQYEDAIKSHSFKVLAGYNYEQSSTSKFFVRRNGLVYGNATDINLALGQSIQVEGGAPKWRVAGLFSRFNYSYADRYLLELNGRYDGSSKFPTDEQWAFFPSGSIGWRVNNEPFWKIPSKIIGDFKLRVSYGSLGNGNIAPYAFNERFTIKESDRVLAGIRPPQTSQPNIVPAGLTWETSTTANYGLDLSAINNKLKVSVDVYQRKTKNMFTKGLTMPAIYGADAPFGNYADLKTNGWELSVTWRNQFNVAQKPFTYNIGVSLADSKSIITRYNNSQKNLTDYYVGMEVGEIWGYETSGFFTNMKDIADSPTQTDIPASNGKNNLPGDVKFADLNGDKKINNGLNTVDDPGDRKIIGNSSPRYTYSINLGGEWGGFFANVMLQGVAKQDWWPGAESRFWGQYNRPYNDMPAWHVNNSWSEENPNAYLPRLRGYVSMSGRELGEAQTKYLQNASYIRLKNVQIGYTLPSQLTQKIGISQLKLYVSGENLYTWSPMYKYSKDTDVGGIYGSDRDLTSGTSGNGYNYPLLKSMTFGASITF